MTQPSTGAINASLRPEVDIGLLSATTAEGCYLDSRRTERRGCYIISRQSRPSASTSMWLWITFGSKGDLRRPSVRQSAITEDF